MQKWIDALLADLLADISTRPPPPNTAPPPPPPSTPPPPSKRLKSEPMSEFVPPPEPAPIFFASQPPPSPVAAFRPPRIERQAPPHLPNPLAPAQPGLAFLPLFNETATRRGVTVDYPSEFYGPSHAGQWTVQCVGKCPSIYYFFLHLIRISKRNTKRSRHWRKQADGEGGCRATSVLCDGMDLKYLFFYRYVSRAYSHRKWINNKSTGGKSNSMESRRHRALDW